MSAADPIRSEGEALRALAIETSGRIGSVALVENGQVLRDETFPHGLQHAARMIPAIDSLSKQLGWTSRDLREIYVSAGPGSFTGLRIGITLAKTLAFATGAKIAAVPTVNVIAQNAPAEAQHLIVVLDAKRDQIFTASFARSPQGWRTVVPAHLGTMSEMLAQSPRPIHLIGEGIPYHRKFIPESDAQITIVEESRWRPQAKVVAALGWELARKDQWTDPMKFLPIYIRRPEAEEKAEAKTQAERSAGA